MQASIKQKHILLFSLFLSLIIHGTFGSSSQRPIATANEQQIIPDVTVLMESHSNASFSEHFTDYLSAVATTSDEMTTAGSASSVVKCYNCDIVDYDKCKENSWTSDCVTNICYVNITRRGGSINLVSMGCVMDINECLYYDSPDHCSMNDTICLLCCNSTWCNSAIFDNLLPLGAANMSYSDQGNSSDSVTSPLPDQTARTNASELVTSFTSPVQDTTRRYSEIVKESSLKAYESTIQNLEPVTILSKIDQHTTAGTEELPRTATDSVQHSLQCYSCDFGSAANCETNAWPLECGTNVCYLNLTNSDSGYLVSMGCTSNINECLKDKTSNQCSRNETTCLLCCNTTWCNSNILDQLLLTTPEPLTNSPFRDQEVTDKTSAKPESAQSAQQKITTETTLPATVTTATTRESVSITLHNSILECYECLGEHDWLCNRTASLKKCQSIDEICYWSINNTRSSFASSKGCISKNECYALTAPNSASCGDFTTVEEQCTWCCEDESKCNYDRGNYSEISSSSDLPPVEYCNASNCIIMFQLLVAEASKEPDLFFSHFCRSVPLVFGCISNVTSQCAVCDSESTDIMESVLTNMTALCPVPCDPDAGFNCTIMFYYDIVESLSSHGIDCKEMSEIERSKARCRVRTVGSCDVIVREAVDVTYDAISSEIKAICNTTYPDFPTIEGTESPNCDILLGIKCITDFGDEIIRYFLRNTDNLKQICELSSRSKQCYDEIALVCSDIKRQYLDMAWNFTFGLINDKCTTKICDTTKARKCIVDLMSLIEAKKDIQGACRMIPWTIECVSINTEGCTSDEQESLNDTLKYTLNLIGNQCNDYVQVFANETIEICEGDDPVQFSYILNSSPSLICGAAFGCRIFLDFEIEIGSYPRCRNGNPIRQAVIVKSNAQGSSESLCSNEVTEDNWNHHQNVSIAAKLDFKYDKTQYRKMIIWYRKTINNITMERRSLRNITLVICDRDQSNSICSSVNDPHIRTFDGWYYNNFLEGFFILYRHRFLPFEVQIATQRCNGRATCNCATYVRSGDTVLAIDKCRKKSFFEKWCRSRNIGKFECSNVMKFHLYGHDRITPGTKIYSRNNGKQFFVIFPSGTQVKITVDGNYISIYITPSPIDYRNTAGLCGLFDNNDTNDLVLRNGNSYQGEGFYHRGQPKDFCKDWRPAISENIYQGVSKRPYNHELYCECDGNKENSSLNSKCNTNALLELCDVDTSGEEIRPIFEFSESQVDNDDGHMDNESKRRRRQAEANPLGDFDIEENFDPPNVPADNTTVSWATEVCQNFFNSVMVAQQCQKESVADFTATIAGCVDDLMITNSTLWMTTALDSLKEHCLRELSQNPVYIDDPVKAQIADEVQSASCLSQCNSHGICTKGTCTCDAGYTGIDCGFDLTMKLDYLEVYNSFCDLKQSNCSSAQITGVGFIPNITLCRVQPVMVTEKGMEANGDSEAADLIFISPNEVHCQLNKQISALIDVFNTDFAQNSSLFIIIYDSTCYDCSYHLTIQCVKVKNSCVINGGCYGPGQENEVDKCMICRPDKSDSEWTFNSDSDSCNMNIPLIVGLCVGLGCGLIVLAIIVIIIVYKVRCAGSQKLPSLDEYETMSHSSVHRSNHFAYENLFKTERIEVAGTYCDGQFSAQKEGPCPEIATFPKSTKESFGL